MLKNSARKSIFNRSVMVVDFTRVASKFAKHGPINVFRPTFPKNPAVGKVKTLESKYLFRPPRIGTLVTPGARLGRSGTVLSPSPERLKPVVTVNGVPGCRERMPPSCQPLNNLPEAPDLK